MAFVVPFLASIGSALGASAASAAAVGGVAAAAGVKMIGSAVQGAASAESSKYNAAVAQQNADIAIQQGEASAQAQQRDSARKIGAMVAAYGASGVQGDAGSPLDVLADSVRMSTLDNLTIKYNAQLRAAGYTAQSQLSNYAASSARTSSVLNMFGDVASGAADYAKVTRGTSIPNFGGTGG